MNDFAIIIHPVNDELIRIFDPGTAAKRPEVLRKILELTPPFYTCKIDGIQSPTGKTVDGHFVMCPLLPDQILNHSPDFVLKRVLQAAKTAEGLGVKILGLSAYVSLVGRKGALIAKQVSIPVTVGSSYTIATALGATLRSAEFVGLDITQSHVVVVGATGTIGSACSAFLARKAKSLTLVGRNKQRLSDLAILFCPSDTEGAAAAVQNPADPQQAIDKSSYTYLGYAITNEIELKAFVEAYKDRVTKGLRFDEDLDVPPGAGTGGGNKILRLREGIEPTLVTDSHNPAASLKSQSSIPIMWDKVQVVDGSVKFNHPPGGANVLYMDGHVEFIEYPGKWPMTKETVQILNELCNPSR